MIDLAFVLVENAELPKAKKVVKAAAAAGISLSLSKDQGDGPMTFEFGESVSLLVMPVDVPHPDVAEMPVGPLSPSQEELVTAPAHLIVTALGLEGENAERDRTMAALTAAVMAGVKPVGVMLSHGVLFHHPGMFSEFAIAAASEGELPVEICVDVTAAQEPDDRMSFLTHGMQRYGREEFYITAPTEGTGALDFTFSMMRWLIEDPTYHLPTGDTVGRTAEEKILVQRVPNPIGEDPEVIRLDLT